MDIMEILKDGVCQINIVVEKENIPENTGLIEEGILDSYGFVELIAFIENEFGIEIKDDDITRENFRNLSATNKFINKRLNA